MTQKTIGSVTVAAYTRSREQGSADAMFLGTKNAGRNNGSYQGRIAFFSDEQGKLHLAIDCENLVTCGVEIHIEDTHEAWDSLLSGYGL